MRKNQKLILLGFFLVLFVSCTREPKVKSKKIKFLDLRDAVAITVLPQNFKNSRTAERNDQFYKIISDGNLEKVISKNVDGETINVVPKKVLTFGNGYLLFLDENFYCYLINQNSGDAYFLEEINDITTQIVNSNSLYYKQSVFYDDYKNLYFIYEGKIRKINYSDINKVTLETISPDYLDILSIDEFCVDKEGNVLYSYEDKSSHKKYVNLQTPSKKIFKIESWDAEDVSFRDFEGNIVFAGKKFIVKEEDGQYYLDYETSENIGRTIGADRYLWFYFNDKIVTACSSVGDELVKSGVLITEIYSKSGAKQPLQVELDRTIKIIQQSDTALYAVSDKGEIYKISINDYSSEKIFSNRNIDIYNFLVTTNELIYFTAFNNENSKKMFGTIDSSGEIKLITEDISDDISILKRIN